MSCIALSVSERNGLAGSRDAKGRYARIIERRVAVAENNKSFARFDMCSVREYIEVRLFRAVGKSPARDVGFVRAAVVKLYPVVIISVARLVSRILRTHLIQCHAAAAFGLCREICRILHYHAKA